MFWTDAHMFAPFPEGHCTQVTVGCLRQGSLGAVDVHIAHDEYGIRLSATLCLTRAHWTERGACSRSVQPRRATGKEKRKTLRHQESPCTPQAPEPEGELPVHSKCPALCAAPCLFAPQEQPSQAVPRLLPPPPPHRAHGQASGTLALLPLRACRLHRHCPSPRINH